MYLYFERLMRIYNSDILVSQHAHELKLIVSQQVLIFECVFYFKMRIFVQNDLMLMLCFVN